MTGTKTEIGYSYPADNLSSGQISLAVDDLVTVFDRKTSEDIATGHVVCLDETWVTVVPLDVNADPVAYKPSVRGFKPAFS